MPFSEMSFRVTLLRTGVSEERVASIISVEGIRELRRMIAVTSN
jgi:hypothetical protein